MLKPLQPFSFVRYETATKGVVFQGAMGDFRLSPLCPLESPAPPDGLRATHALKYPAPRQPTITVCRLCGVLGVVCPERRAAAARCGTKRSAGDRLAKTL